MDKQITSYEWSLNYLTEKKKQYSYMAESLLPMMVVMLFIFPGLAFFFFIFLLILIGSISRNDGAAASGGMIVEKYRIDDEGITVEDIRKKRVQKYTWKKLANYCPYSVQKPLYGAFFKKYAGDDYIVQGKGGDVVKLKAGISDSAMVNSILSKKLKLRNTLNIQSGRSFRMDPFKVSALNSNIMAEEKRNFNRPQKFSSGDDEKRFYEEKRNFERKYAKASEKAFRNRIVGIYIALVILSLIGYSIYLAAKESKTGNKIDGDGLNTSKIADKGVISGSEYIVSCRADSDCQYYFFSTDNSGSMGPIPNLMRVSDSNGCVWALINKQYGQTWSKEYPAPQKCILSSSIKNKKRCDLDRKVCVVGR